MNLKNESFIKNGKLPQLLNKNTHEDEINEKPDLSEHLSAYRTEKHKNI